MPRFALLLLCAAYLMPGLIGRGPWKSADITAFGYMAELARTTEGLARWLDPMLLGIRPETPSLLPYWIGALAIKLAPSWIHPDLAVRIAFALLLWGVFMASWYAAYFLARTPRAQPVAFAFGGEAKPTDYARAIADGALLALIACLGLAQLGHETTPALAQLFFATHMLYGVAAMPYQRRGAIFALVIGTFGMSLSGAPTIGLTLGLGSALLIVLGGRKAAAAAENPFDTHYGEVVGDMRGYSAKDPLLIAGVAVLAALLVILLGLWHMQIALPGTGTNPNKTLASDLRSLAKLMLWFTWPAWPLAMWTLWRWRGQLMARHVALPLLFALAPVAATLTTDFSDRSLLLALPAISMLAAFALPTLRRSVAALVDWFTLLFFSSAAFVIWGYWIAMQTGFPPKMAASVARLTPGFIPQFSWLTLIFALAATLAWCWLVRWRTGRHQAALWKSLVLPGGGAALCWLLGTTLWLPALDYALSYAPQVRAVSERIAQGEAAKRADGQPSPQPCVTLLGVGRAHIAALRYHGQFDLQPVALRNSCDWMLVGPDAIARVREVASFDQWSLVGTMRRPSSASDDLLLYQRSER